MGNLFSKEKPISAAAIEEMYAAQAAAARAQGVNHPSEETPGESTHESQANVNDQTSDSGTEVDKNPFELPHRDLIAIQRTIEALSGSVPQNSAVSAACHLTLAVRAYYAKAAGAFEYAVAELRKMGVINVAKVLAAWIMARQWETAAIVVPLILVACTPAVLGVVGFGSGGIVAGSIAAGIQAGIGNVAAGSTFAVLTSAMMGGYGIFPVFGGVWGISTMVMGGIALWKRWRGSGDDGADHDCPLAIKYNDEDNSSDDDSDDSGAKGVMCN
ncbi:hypothetical protein IAQ61_002472 [Plenodomus lingam]|uniref:Predicted protein n=1 Tax=Leptosphaeria maculans (strain JN3 / isolate v23.1.3 / race Av1-4-5-6-7-8) TaxID=985895 RepID=E4ZII5_LEPMJ|nr:predicted protein [Plenodomus lingam JN3]KAH9877109.1 hypothetical protein IAQ61_002472 [Plenodomus lingam]CBX91006.1 predicted protein [Plenodomus lingam JN3]